MNPIQTAILWGLAALDPKPVKAERLFKSMRKHGCFGDHPVQAARVEFVTELIYLEILDRKIEGKDDHYWLTNSGRAIVSALCAKQGLTLEQMQAVIRGEVLMALLERAPEGECAQA